MTLSVESPRIPHVDGVNLILDAVSRPCEKKCVARPNHVLMSAKLGFILGLAGSVMDSCLEHTHMYTECAFWLKTKWTFQVQRKDFVFSFHNFCQISRPGMGSGLLGQGMAASLHLSCRACNWGLPWAASRGCGRMGRTDASSCNAAGSIVGVGRGRRIRTLGQMGGWPNGYTKARSMVSTICKKFHFSLATLCRTPARYPLTRWCGGIARTGSLAIGQGPIRVGMGDAKRGVTAHTLQFGST